MYNSGRGQRTSHAACKGASTGLTFNSQNCNGLGNKVKRQAVFTKLMKKGQVINFLQETHCTLHTQNEFKEQFSKANLYFSNGSSNSNGVLTAISKDFDIKVQREAKDNEGRFLILDIEYDNEIYTLGNMYAPTRNFEQNQIIVLDNFINLMTDFNCTNLILGGDWNLYLSVLLDKLHSMSDGNDNATYRINLKSFLEVHNLVDVWRTINPYEKVFTWHRGHKRSRLDYFFISEHLLNKLETVKILPGIHSDHSLIHLSLDSVTTTARGKGFWKFPEKLLHDQEYVVKLKDIIKSKTNEYTIEDLGLKWDLIKMDIRNFTVPYCSYKKKETSKHEKILNEKFTQLHTIVNSDSIITNEVLEDYNKVKLELESLEKEHARGIIVRSKVQHVEEGEKCTSYFLRQEKNNYNNKHITKLIDHRDGNITEDPQGILDMQKHFYSNLYNDNSDISNEGENELFREITIPQMSNRDKLKCEDELSESEILKSVKAMKSGKSPGTCGLTSEFYKFFWTDIKGILLSSINYNLRNGKLSIEQRRGILTLIPKKDKDRLYLKNWRPLTLLNTDYKILAKALANRLTKFLPFLVEDDQTGYISGRFMGCNIRMIEDIIMQSQKLNIAGILLTIDFEKAFDSLRWSFIKKALKAFNFGNKFISYVSAMYNQIMTTVINNGHISSWFYPKRGVRQGCPLSPYLFILSVEVLACQIRQNKDIKGLIFNNVELKISQLADDTTCVVRDETSLKYLLETFKQYEKGAGLGINVDKTTARCLGNFEPSTPDCLGLKWTQDPVFTLGVFISGDEDDHYELNFKPKLIKMKHLLNSWKCRRLSIKGKVTVINSLAISKLIYLASIIKVPERIYDEVKKLTRDFLWDGKTSKIAYSTLIQTVEMGGLKLVDFETKVKSLSIMYIKRLCDDSLGKWKALPTTFYKTDDLIFYFSCNQSPLKNINGPKFYTQIQKYWSELTEIDITNPYTLLKNQIIWNNRYITIQNKPFIWSRWKNAGINLVKDILDNNGYFLTSVQFMQKYGLETNFLELLQIRNSLPYNWRTKLQITHQPVTVISHPFYTIKEKTYSIKNSDSKTAYLFFTNSRNTKPTCITKWQEIFPNFDDKKQKQIFKRTFSITRETKMQSFQYKIIHRTITCRKWLFDKKLIDSNKCEVCPYEIDTLSHFFVACPYVNAFWNQVILWINMIYINNQIIDITDQIILFGLEDEVENSAALNYIILLAKYFIYRHRVNGDHNLNLQAFQAGLYYKLKIEKIIAVKNKTTHFNKFSNVFEVLQQTFA